MLSDRSFGALQGPFGGNTPVLMKGVMNQDVHESKMQQGVFCRVGSRCGIGVKYQEHFLPEHVIQTLTIRCMDGYGVGELYSWALLYIPVGKFSAPL